MLTCPSCGGAADEAAPGRDSCPRCDGNLAVPADDLIASWVVPAASPQPRRAEDVECRTCGYSGEMRTVENRLVCPACLAKHPLRRIAETLAAARLEDAPVAAQAFDCPNCGRSIEVRDIEAGKSVICSSCNSFLGCMKKKEDRPWWLRGLLRGM
jgi:hypothetical protein